MAKALTLRNVPEQVVRELRRRARRSGRSMQSELLTVVRQSTLDERSLEDRLREIRLTYSRRMRLDEIQAAVRQGRP